MTHLNIKDINKILNLNCVISIKFKSVMRISFNKINLSEIDSCPTKIEMEQKLDRIRNNCVMT